MSRLRSLVAASGATVAAVAMTTAGLTGLAQASPKPAETILAGSAPSFTSYTPATGDVAASTQLTIQLWLKPNVAAAERFATAVSTPGSTNFRQYLSPAAYTVRFGPTPGEASRVESWLRSQGFTAVHTDAQRSYVRATAPVSKIDAALRVKLKTYKATASVNAGPYALRANDRAVTLPTSLAGSVLGVTGLDNAAPVLR